MRSLKHDTGRMSRTKQARPSHARPDQLRALRPAATTSPDRPSRAFTSTWENSLSHRFQNAIDAADFRKRQTRASKQPTIAFLIIGLFAAGTAICAALLAPVLWAAVTDVIQQSRLTYVQCSSVKKDDSRLACYDRVLGRNSLHAAKGADQVTLGERVTEPEPGRQR